MISFKGLLVCAVALSTTGFATVEEQLISSQEIPHAQMPPLNDWLDDFAEAQKQALEKQKPILIAFLGPSWCSWSDQLESDVLSDPQFVKALEKEVIFLKVDIPEEMAEPSEELLPLLKLKDQYHVEECPALVLVEPMGTEITKLKYLPLEGKKFASYIHEILNDFAAVNHAVERKTLQKIGGSELKALYAKAGQFADSTFKRTLLKKGLKEDRSPYFLLEEYGYLVAQGEMKERKLSRVRNKILARDPKNEKGALRQLAIFDFEALSVRTKRSADVEKAIAPLVQYLKTFGKDDSENAWRIELMISEYLFGKDQVEDALLHAKASLEIAPSSAKKEVAKSIDYLQTKLPGQ